MAVHVRLVRAGRPLPRGLSRKNQSHWQMQMMELELDFLDLDQLDFSIDPQVMVPFSAVGLEEYKLDSFDLASPGSYYNDVPPENNPEAMLDALVRTQNGNSLGSSPRSDSSIPCEEEVENLKIDDTIAECFVNNKTDFELPPRPVYRSTKAKGNATSTVFNTEINFPSTPTKQKSVINSKDKKSQGLSVRFSNEGKQTDSTAKGSNSKGVQKANATGRQVTDTTLLAEHSATSKTKGTLGKLRSLFPERKSEVKEQTEARKNNQKWQQQSMSKSNKPSKMGNKIQTLPKTNDSPNSGEQLRFNESTGYYNPLAMLNLPKCDYQSDRHSIKRRNWFQESRLFYSTSTDDESTTLSAANSEISEIRAYDSVSDVTDITDVTPMTSVVSSRKHSVQSESFQYLDDQRAGYVTETDDEISDTSSIISDLSPEYSDSGDVIIEDENEKRKQNSHFSKYTNLLFFTAKNGDSKSLDSLLSSEDVSCLQDVEGNTLAHHAAAGGNADCLLYLASKANNVFSILNKKGSTPIMLVIQAGKVGCLERYLNSRYSTEKDAGLLLHAAAVGQDDCLRAISRKFPDSISYTDSKGNTSLHLAAASGHMACLQTLVAHRSDVTARNSGHATPLECAEQNKRHECAEYLRLVETCDKLRTELNHLSQVGARLKLELEAKQDQKQMVISQRDSLQAELIKSNNLNDRWRTIAEHVTALLKAVSHQLEDIFNENSTLREKLNGRVKNTFVEEKVEDSLERIIMMTEEIEELMEQNQRQNGILGGETGNEIKSQRTDEIPRGSSNSSGHIRYLSVTNGIDEGEKRPSNCPKSPNHHHKMSSQKATVCSLNTDPDRQKRPLPSGNILCSSSYETQHSTRQRQLQNSSERSSSALVALKARGLTSSNDSIASSTRGRCMFENTMKAFDQVLCSSLESFATLDGVEKPPVGRLGPSPLAVTNISDSSHEKSPADDSSSSHSTLDCAEITGCEERKEGTGDNGREILKYSVGDCNSSLTGTNTPNQSEIKSKQTHSSRVKHGTLHNILQAQNTPERSQYQSYIDSILCESDEGQWDERSSFNLEVGPVFFEESAIDVGLQHIPTYHNRTSDYVESVSSLPEISNDVNRMQLTQEITKNPQLKNHESNNIDETVKTDSSSEDNRVHVEDIQICIPKSNMTDVHQRYDNTINSSRLLKAVVEDDNNRIKAIGSLEDVRVVSHRTNSNESLAASKSELAQLHKLEGRGKKKTVKTPCTIPESDPYENYVYTANLNSSVHNNNNSKKRNTKLFNFIRSKDDVRRNSFIKSVEFTRDEFFESYARVPDKSLKTLDCNGFEHDSGKTDKTNGNYVQQTSKDKQQLPHMDKRQGDLCDRAKMYLYHGKPGASSSCDSESETELRPRPDLSRLYYSADLDSRNSKESSGTLSAASADDDDVNSINNKDMTGQRPCDGNSWTTWCELSSEDGANHKCKPQWSNHIEGFVI